MMEEEGGKEINGVLMSIVGSGRGSLLGGSGRVLMGGRLVNVLGGGEKLDLFAFGVEHRCGGSEGRKHGR